MKIVAISGSVVGRKTRSVMNHVLEEVGKQDPHADVTLIDLKDYDLEFSDGRNYLDYSGDTGEVTKLVMDADILIIGTPIFQASIPGTLKNLFDLLPQNAFRNKIVSFFVTSGSAKHYLVAEVQLKLILDYMKAHVVHPYVFVEEQDLFQDKIMNGDIILRIERLVEDTLMNYQAFKQIREEREAQYDF